jgi:hypothetical protein
MTTKIYIIPVSTPSPSLWIRNSKFESPYRCKRRSQGVIESTRVTSRNTTARRSVSLYVAIFHRPPRAHGGCINGLRAAVKLPHCRPAPGIKINEVVINWLCSGLEVDSGMYDNIEGSRRASIFFSSSSISIFLIASFSIFYFFLVSSQSFFASCGVTQSSPSSYIRTTSPPPAILTLLTHLSWEWRQHVLPKQQYLPNRLVYRWRQSVGFREIGF